LCRRSPAVATLYEFQKQGLVPPSGVLWGAVFIIAAVVALLLADGRTADTALACAWSTVLAYSMLPRLVVPLGAIVHTFGSAGSVSRLAFGHPVPLVTLALLICLFVVLFAGSAGPTLQCLQCPLPSSRRFHGQSRWERNLNTARRIEQDDWERPDKDRRVGNIIRAVATSSRPAVLVAHSLGAHAVAHAAEKLPQAAVSGAFLVAPPDLDKPEMFPA
jgi:Serine hydrolase